MGTAEGAQPPRAGPEHFLWRSILVCGGLCGGLYVYERLEVLSSAKEDRLALMRLYSAHLVGENIRRYPYAPNTFEDAECLRWPIVTRARAPRHRRTRTVSSALPSYCAEGCMRGSGCFPRQVTFSV
jgi:hypothetical protein